VACRTKRWVSKGHRVSTIVYGQRSSVVGVTWERLPPGSTLELTVRRTYFQSHGFHNLETAEDAQSISGWSGSCGHEALEGAVGLQVADQTRVNECQRSRWPN